MNPPPLESSTPQLPASNAAWTNALIAVAGAAADVANYCDHVEHCEEASRDWALGAGKTLRAVAMRLAAAESLDALDLYARRLDAVERRHPAFPVQGFLGRPQAEAAQTWHDLQRVQLEHDRLYHPDVLGLHKQDQLRHYALHLAKLTGALARAVGDDKAAEDVRRRRLADLLLFGIKLATVLGQRLPDEPLPRAR